MTTLTDRLAALPFMPPEITREGPYRVYKGVRYTVYDDGNSADTARLRDLSDAFAARNALLCEALREARRSHYYCDDSWYSCPQAEDGCSDSDAGTTCRCGADEFNAKVDAILAACEQKP